MRNGGVGAWRHAVKFYNFISAVQKWVKVSVNGALIRVIRSKQWRVISVTKVNVNLTLNWPLSTLPPVRATMLKFLPPCSSMISTTLTFSLGGSISNSFENLLGAFITCRKSGSRMKFFVGGARPFRVSWSRRSNLRIRRRGFCLSRGRLRPSGSNCCEPGGLSGRVNGSLDQGKASSRPSVHT